MSYGLITKLIKKIIPLFSRNLIRFINFLIAEGIFRGYSKYGVLPTFALGPMLLYADKYLNILEASNSKHVIYADFSETCNAFILKYFSKYLNIVDCKKRKSIFTNGGFHYLKLSNRALPIYDFQFLEKDVFFSKRKSVFRFTEEEESNGWKLLSRLGVKKEDRIVTFHCRNDDYWISRGILKQEVRNSLDTSFNKAINYLHDRGYKIIRIGIHSQKLDNVLYYDDFLKEEVEFLDIFISSVCKFAISGNSGTQLFPCIFGKPLLLHNHIPVGDLPPYPKVLVLPKTLHQDGKYVTASQLDKLTFNSINSKNFFHCPVKVSMLHGRFIQDFKRFNIEIYDNTPVELLNATKEIVSYSEKEYFEPEAISMTQKYLDQFPNEHYGKKYFEGIFSPSYLKSKIS